MMKRHKGNPKPQKGFGFPQHLRERERERDREKNGADENTEHKRKREGTANIWADRGQVLKGETTKHHSNPRDKRKHQTEYPTSIPEKPNINQISKPTKSRRTCHRRVEGGHGPPCTFGESPQGTAVPRGTSTPPLREPPPVAQKADNLPDTRRIPQKSCPST